MSIELAELYIVHNRKYPWCCYLASDNKYEFRTFKLDNGDWIIPIATFILDNDKKIMFLTKHGTLRDNIGAVKVMILDKRLVKQVPCNDP